jgi:hypothetical protein
MNLLVKSKGQEMDKIIGLLLLVSAGVTLYLSYFDSSRVFVG